MRQHHDIEVGVLNAFEHGRCGSSHRALVSKRLQDRSSRFNVLSAIVDKQNPGWSLRVARKSLNSNLVSTFAIPLGPDHFEASTPAAVLNAYQSARFDS